MNHLQSREFYEERYDRLTVSSGRRNMKTFQSLEKEFFRTTPDEPHNSLRAVLHLNLIYVVFVGNNLLDRYDKRGDDIRDMMAADAAKDQKIVDARLAAEPVCKHCQSTGLRIIDKMLCHRTSFNEPEEVLFTLRCPKCEKNSAVWEDAKPFEISPTPCPQCGAAMNKRDKRKEKVITTTYTCPSCNHQFQDKLDLTPRKETPDPHFEKDRDTYCLQDEKFRQELRDARWRYEEMAKLGKEWKEREENKHLYDAIAKLKRPKVSELTTLINSAIAEVGYIELKLEKPDLGKYVQVDFSCLDSIAKRSDVDSKKTLAKHVNKALEGTSWQLMSNDIVCKFGCLRGRLRAYEREEDLKRLVGKDVSYKVKNSDLDGAADGNSYFVKGKEGEKIIL